MTENNDSILIDKINTLRRERHAVILAHNYQPGEIQDIADYVGDSLELSIKAASLPEPVIVFCGVKFMAETAKILAPDRCVLLPRPDAGCPMADMADPAALRQLKQQHPGAVTVCYVNSTAAVKTECDICCTSANAAAIVNSIPADREIIFLPDRNLGANVARQTGRQLILWPGYCPTHMLIIPEMLRQKRIEYPDAVIMIHPECPPDTVAEADEVLSTGGMIRLARESKAQRFIVGTESGIIHRLRQENPTKTFIPVSDRAICPNMKKTTLKDVAAALENMSPAVTLDENERRRAELPIRRMLKGKLES